MKKNFTIIFAMLLCLFYTRGNAQTQFWSDTFEDTGAPSSGLRVPSVPEFTFGGPPPTAYFFRTIPTGIALQSGTYTAFQGAKIWAAEDIDKGSAGVNGTLSPNQQVTWSAISIAGKSGLSFKGTFAANNLNAGWNGSNFAPLQDFIAIEYRIDGGSWTKIIAFYAGAITTTNALSLDTNGDLIGDGAALGYAFSEFTANIPGTGTLLEIRLNCSANGSDSQEFAVDNFRLFETPACTAPVITANPPNRSLCPGSNTTFSAGATGATTYKWQVDQTGAGTYTDLANAAPYSGVTTNTLTITGVTTAMSTYRYRAVAINGVATCFANTNYGTLSVSNITLAGAQDNIVCVGTATGSASVIPSGGIGTYTYSWFPSGGSGSIATGLIAGTYTVTVTDGILCQATKTFTIIETGTPISIVPTQTNVSCNGGSNGSATATATGGSGTLTYSWSPSGGTAATASGLTAGAYTVTVTDANGCSKPQAFNIIQPSLIVTSGTQVNVSCNGGSNGSATVTATGGAGSYTYSWSPSGGTAATASGLTAGAYTVTVTDANGCTKPQAFNIIQPSLIVTSGTQVNVSCNGGSNASATVTATGGAGSYTYSWSPSGGTAATASGLTAGAYTVTVTDANGCTKPQVFNIIEPSLIVTSGTQVNVSCNGGSNASATVTATGGAGSYTYSWSPSGGTAATASGLTAGTYTVTVTDENGCFKDQSFTIIEPTAITTSGTHTNVSCNGQADGTATVTASGGSGALSYTWSPSGGTAATATGLTAGTYTVTVTDENGCFKDQSFTIIEPVAHNLAVTFGGNNVLSASQSGATYQWYQCSDNSPIPGEIGQSFAPIANGSYKVAITLNGCTVSSQCVVVSTLATPEFEKKAQFIMYPNPSKGVVNINTDHDSDLNIVNQWGQTIKKVKVSADTTNSINIESLTDGIYFICEVNGNKVITHKLILKK
ncbi:T9SS type A sorting domain-containing protein [Flavobacterium sp. KMS]|uniref:T9SS type A sorting domain-containing protein n=1 Tax=Flavobacterium sp. KMS TaxID=1566023 RepID=UPI000690CA83|nr:T9SS type A sorting domain-containing protein [Flavobacterium sp. KMS]